MLDSNNYERMIPEAAGVNVFWEHAYRYAFAAQYVKGKAVLDIACGEGYGAASLRAAGASNVIGVDVAAGACSHAKDKYGIETRQGSAESIPLADAEVDAVVSFETIEHVARPLLFLDECKRVLRPGGILIISTPNKDVFSRRNGSVNPHHCSEMRPLEFRTEVCARFDEAQFFAQRLYSAPWWNPRALGSEQMPGSSVKLIRRLQDSAKFRLAPSLYRDVPDAVRAATVQAILKIAKTRHSVLNPYVVRTWRERGEIPIYMLATARRQQ